MESIGINSRVNFRGANWLYGGVDRKGRIMLKSVSKNVEDRVVSKADGKYVYLGWK